MSKQWSQEIVLGFFLSHTQKLFIFVNFSDPNNQVVELTIKHEMANMKQQKSEELVSLAAPLLGFNRHYFQSIA